MAMRGEQIPYESPESKLVMRDTATSSVSVILSNYFSILCMS